MEKWAFTLIPPGYNPEHVDMSPTAEKGVLGRGELEQLKQTRGSNYLLAIAIDRYEHGPPLYNAVSDAEAFIHLLTSQYDFAPENVFVLFDTQATERAIHDVFKKLIRVVSQEDSLVVFYSGHGEYDPDIEEGYWIPVDAHFGNTGEYISNSRIIKYIRAIHSQHTFFIVDSCFSGSLFAQRGATGREMLESVPSRWLLTAGRNEVVSDGKPGDHSPFADNVLYFLEHNTDPSLSVTRLIEEVVDATVANARQIPRGEPLQDVGHKGGQFFFHLRQGEEEAWAQARQANTMGAYLAFKERFPQGKFSDQALSAIETLEEEQAWETATHQDRLSGYLKYQRDYPDGKHLAETREKIRTLQPGKERPTSPAPAPTPSTITKVVSPSPKEKSAPSRARWPWWIAGALIVIIAGVLTWRFWPGGEVRDPELPTGLEEREAFSDGLAAAFDGTNWGYINERYQLVIEPQYESAGPFRAGRAPVRLPTPEGLKWGFIDEHGRFITPVWFDDAAPFEEGTGWLMIREVEFWVNVEGQCVENCPLAAVTVWEPIGGSKQIADLENFVRLFPDSPLAPLAGERLELLNELHSIESLDQRLQWIIEHAELAERKADMESALWFYELGLELDPQNQGLIEAADRCREQLPRIR